MCMSYRVCNASRGSLSLYVLVVSWLFMRNHATCNSFRATVINFPAGSFVSVLVTRYVPHTEIAGMLLAKIPYVVFRLLLFRKQTKSPAAGSTFIAVVPSVEQVLLHSAVCSSTTQET